MVGIPFAPPAKTMMLLGFPAKKNKNMNLQHGNDVFSYIFSKQVEFFFWKLRSLKGKGNIYIYYITFQIFVQAIMGWLPCALEDSGALKRSPISREIDHP